MPFDWPPRRCGFPWKRKEAKSLIVRDNPLPQTSQTLAGNGRRLMRERNHRIGTVSTESVIRSKHHRLGYFNKNVISAMNNEKRYRTHWDDLAITQDCISCTHAKRTRKQYDAKLIAKGQLVTIYADIFCPMRKISCRGKSHFLAMTTGQQKYVRVQFLKPRAVVKGYFETYINGI